MLLISPYRWKEDFFEILGDFFRVHWKLNSNIGNVTYI